MTQLYQVFAKELTRVAQQIAAGDSTSQEVSMEFLKALHRRLPICRGAEAGLTLEASDCFPNSVIAGEPTSLIFSWTYTRFTNDPVAPTNTTRHRAVIKPTWFGFSLKVTGPAFPKKEWFEQEIQSALSAEYEDWIIEAHEARLSQIS